MDMTFEPLQTIHSRITRPQSGPATSGFRAQKMRHAFVLGLVLLAASCATQNTPPPGLSSAGASCVLPLVDPGVVKHIPCVLASVNGKQGLFVIDTGSNCSVLDTRFAKAIGLTGLSLPDQSPDSGANDAGNATVDSLDLGTHHFGQREVLVMDISHLSRAMNREIAGIIGLGELKSLARVQIDSIHDRLVLDPPKTDAPLRAPITVTGEDVMTMDARIGGETVRMTVDTGDTHTELPAEPWGRLAATAKVETQVLHHANIEGLQKESELRAARTEVTVGNVTQKDFPVLEGADTLLGMDFLGRYAVTFDFEAKTAFFEPATPPPAGSIAAQPVVPAGKAKDPQVAAPQAAPAPVKETAKEVVVDDDWLTTKESDLKRLDADGVAKEAVTTEGAKFFYFLNQTGALEATPKDSLKEFDFALHPRAFKVKYPVSVKIDIGKLQDPAAGRQRYILTKDAENAPWRMTEGWAVAPKGQKGAALPLPSEESQAAANKHVSEHVKKHK